MNDKGSFYMKNNVIYSYRLTYFGGTAPCYDNNLLTLAICKRDMRRVIGREFRKNRLKKTYWFIGIVGTGLEKSSRSVFEGRAGTVLYIAKLKDVIDFSDYFSNPIFRKRLDRIYEESDDGDFGTTGNEKRFKHVDCSISNVHCEKELQERDWDVAHCSKETFVLVSEEYSFIDPQLSNDLIESLSDGEKLANGVGHSLFEAEDDSRIVCLMNSIVNNAGKTHSKEKLPQVIRDNCNKGCGKDKA